MTESTALTVDAYLNPQRWEQMTKLAESLVQSKAFPRTIQNAPQALVVMQAGTEMGLKPMEAIMGLAIINGQVSPWGKTTVRLLKNHGWKISYEALNERGGGVRATITKDDESYTDVLYFDQAQKSKWTEMWNKDKGKWELKPGWYEGANREMKLRYGVLSKIIKTYVPEVMGSASDIAEIAEDYTIIEETQSQDEAPKAAEVMTATPDDRKKGLAEFIEANKNKPKSAESGQKTQKIVENGKKNDEKSAENDKKPQKQGGGADPQPTIKMQEIIEGEVVAEGGTGEGK